MVGIAAQVFERHSIDSITVPESVTYIAEEAFLGCESLWSITVPVTLLPIVNDVLPNPYTCFIYTTYRFDGNPKPSELTAFEEGEDFGGWFSDPDATVAFDLDAWLAADRTVGDTVTLHTKNPMPKILLPMMIERTAFETKILAPLEKALSARDYAVFSAYFSLKPQGGVGVSAAYPITEQKGIDIYVCNANPRSIKTLLKLEAMILEHTDYTFEDLAADYAFVEYEEKQY